MTGVFGDTAFPETDPIDMGLGIKGCDADSSTVPELKRMVLVIGIDGLTLNGLKEA